MLDSLLAVNDTDAEVMSSVAYGTVLDIGTGTGKSSFILSNSPGVTGLLSVEPNPVTFLQPRYTPRKGQKAGVTYMTGTNWYDLNYTPEGYLPDTVFIDSFPVGDRIDAWQFFKRMGCRVLLHDHRLPIMRKHLPYDKNDIVLSEPPPMNGNIGGVLYSPDIILPTWT
jgi:hypothetical protein